ncbi:tyrosine-type recombinase/integrase [Microbacterium sp. RU33B]|uniref:tyrosine-type recombinase/integrase n=1 Tax=Microbacterium sp. RU33B TaxID=1907390 RepID=UPI00095AF7C2|nr:tyrosine-type recombinase/integrase [Microbacterium sp. RU33B]SIT72390.1 Phage integrase family protein [Microbacterium sp. RU33B]
MARPQLAPGTMGKVSLRERAGRWQARANARTHGGALIPLTATGETERKARDAIERAFAAAVVMGAGALSPTSTVGDAIDAWLATQQARAAGGSLRRQSYETYAAKARGARDAVGAVPLHLARPRLIEPIIENLVVGRGVPYARGVQFVLRRSFALAVQREAIEHNPLSESMSLSAPEQTLAHLTPAQWQSMMASIETWGRRPAVRADWRRLVALCSVIVGSSLRIGEVGALRPCDLSLGGSPPAMVVTRTVVEVGGRLIIQDVPKRRGQERHIPLPGPTADALRAVAARAAGPAALLFGTSTGEPDGNPDRLLRTWRSSPEGQAWMQSVGIATRDVTFKLLRRSAASHVRGSAGLEAAQALLGHADAATTERHYAGLPVVDAATARLLEGIWG